MTYKKEAKTVTEHKAKQEELLRKALREIAEEAVPDGTVDLWPAIRERLEERARADAELRRSPWRARFVPTTRAGWVLVALMVLLLGTGAYAASGLVYDFFLSELPGAEEPIFGEKLHQEQTAGGATVTLEWAYADEKYIVVGYSVKDLKDERRVGGRSAELGPVVVADEAGYERRVAELTDQSGTDFDVVDGGGMSSEGSDSVPEEPLPSTVVFAASERVEPGGEHRFRLEIPLQARAISPLFPMLGAEDEVPTEPVGEPFVFEFEIPVRPVPTVEVDQKVRTNGLTLTLERIENSPGRPQAIICFEPPDDEHVWSPVVKKSGLTFSEPADGYLEVRRAGDGCWAAALLDRVEGHASVTVTQIEGHPRNNVPADSPEDVKTIRGPWRFDFEVPGYE